MRQAELRLGLQIESFGFRDLPAEHLFERVVQLARHAESSGFDSVWVMDHCLQLDALGGPTQPMLEAYTLLGAIAARTSRVRLGALVSGVTYRHPALLAKMVTTLDVISGGRAILGIGAAWDEQEHQCYGFDFPPTRERLERLEEAVQLCRAMFVDESPTFDGTHYRVRNARNVPRPIQAGGVPILIGGGGEKTTLRIVAQYGDLCNLLGDLPTIRRKLAVLDEHCRALGRDPAEITKTRYGQLVVGKTMADAERKGDQLRAAFGMDEASYRANVVAGDPDSVAEQVQEYLDAGIDGMIFGLYDPNDLETVELAGRALSR